MTMPYASSISAAAERSPSAKCEDVRGVRHRAALGHGEIGDPVARLADQDFDVVLPVASGHVVDACADSPERVGIRPDRPRHHVHMRQLLARTSAVLAIAGEVENPTQPALQLERLEDELLAAGVVFAGREDG